MRRAEIERTLDEEIDLGCGMGGTGEREDRGPFAEIQVKRACPCATTARPPTTR
jgi:hypothetical protein